MELDLVVEARLIRISTRMSAKVAVVFLYYDMYNQ
jgi:hypothetical protein